MAELRISVEEEPRSEDVDVLGDGLYEYNAATTGYADGRALGVFLRDSEGRIHGGAFGNTWHAVLEVKYLWVEESLRRTGLGTDLLRAIEREAIAHGCHTSMLDTYEFQAPDFYRKLGFEVFGTIDDPQTGFKKYFLKRPLTSVG